MLSFLFEQHMQCTHVHALVIFNKINTIAFDKSNIYIYIHNAQLKSTKQICFIISF